MSPPEPIDRRRRSAWALARVLGDAGRRTRDEWRALPAGNFRGWLLILVLGWVGCALLMAALARLGQSFAPRGMQAWDERTLLAIEARGPLSFTDAILAESPGNLIYLVPLTLAIALLATLARRPVLAWTALASYVLARPLVLVGWTLWHRERPQLIEGGVASLSLNSYPSGHAVLSLAVWGLLAYLWIAASRSWLERAIVALAAAAWVALIGLARIRLGSHWPSDVVAGAVLGLAWLGVVIAALRRGERGRGTESDPLTARV